MTNEQIRALNQIRIQLIKTNNDWKKEIVSERVDGISKLFNIVENHNFNEFLNLRYSSYYYLDDEELRAIINEHTNWLSNPKTVKQIILSKNGFYKIVDKNLFGDIQMWMNILKENECGFFDSLDVYNVFNFNIALQNKELLELSFEKVKHLGRLFFNIDYTKLDKKYFNDIKYIRKILYSAGTRPEVIKLMNKDLLFGDKDIWESNSSELIDTFGLEVIKWIDKSQWLDYVPLRKLIMLDINVFINNYDDIIKDVNLIEVAIDANYDAIKYIKNNDFSDEIKDIIVNKLKRLEDEIYD